MCTKKQTTFMKRTLNEVLRCQLNARTHWTSIDAVTFVTCMIQKVELYFLSFFVLF